MLYFHIISFLVFPCALNSVISCSYTRMWQYFLGMTKSLMVVLLFYHRRLFLSIVRFMDLYINCSLFGFRVLFASHPAERASLAVYSQIPAAALSVAQVRFPYRHGAGARICAPSDSLQKVQFPSRALSSLPPDRDRSESADRRL